MPIFAKKSASKSAPKSDPIGAAFKSLGNDIKKTFTSDKAQEGYKTATNIAIGVASLTPVGKAAATAAIAIADKATGGKATDYLGAQNSTLNAVPGGYLAQAIMKKADPKAQDTLNQYDPKKALIKDATTIGKTAVNNPSQIANTTRSVAAGNVKSVINTPAVKSVARSPAVSTLTKPAAAVAPTPLKVPNISKPSFTSMLKPAMNTSLIPKPPIKLPPPMVTTPPPPPPSTLTITPPTDEDKPTITAPVEEVKPSLLAPPPAPITVNDTPPPSTLSKNTRLQEAIAPLPPPPSPSSSSNNMLPFIGIAAVAAILLLMKR